MIGLLGIGLGLYGFYELSKNVKATKQDMRIKGTGTILDQQRNIDNNFNDILEYCGVKKEKIESHHYKKVEYYMMQKGYSQEAIQYCHQKMDNIVKRNKHREKTQTNHNIINFEQALINDKSREVVVSFSMFGYPTQKAIDKDLNKVIQYLHKHHNENARVNVITTPVGSQYKFNVNWVIKAPYGHNPNNYIEDVEKKLGIL